MGSLNVGAGDTGGCLPLRSRGWPHISILLAIFVLALCSFDGAPRAADLVNASFTPVKGPDCVTDASKSFLAQGVLPPNPPVPYDQFYLVARHMGKDAVAAAPAADFSRVPDDYA